MLRPAVNLRGFDHRRDKLKFVGHFCDVLTYVRPLAYKLLLLKSIPNSSGITASGSANLNSFLSIIKPRKTR